MNQQFDEQLNIAIYNLMSSEIIDFAKTSLGMTDEDIIYKIGSVYHYMDRIPELFITEYKKYEAQRKNRFKNTKKKYLTVDKETTLTLLDIIYYKRKDACDGDIILLSQLESQNAMLSRFDEWYKGTYLFTFPYFDNKKTLLKYFDIDFYCEVLSIIIKHWGTPNGFVKKRIKATSDFPILTSKNNPKYTSREALDCVYSTNRYNVYAALKNDDAKHKNILPFYVVDIDMVSTLVDRYNATKSPELVVPVSELCKTFYGQVTGKHKELVTDKLSKLYLQRFVVKDIRNDFVQGIDFISEYKIVNDIAHITLSNFVVSSVENNDMDYYLNDNYLRLSNDLAKNICYMINRWRNICKKNNSLVSEYSLEDFKNIYQFTPHADLKIWDYICEALDDFVKNKLDIEEYKKNENSVIIKFID